jgi:hypothetical protein
MEYLEGELVSALIGREHCCRFILSVREKPVVYLPRMRRLISISRVHVMVLSMYYIFCQISTALPSIAEAI